MNDTGTLRRKKPRTRFGWLPTPGLIVLALAMFDAFTFQMPAGIFAMMLAGPYLIWLLRPQRR